MVGEEVKRDQGERFEGGGTPQFAPLVPVRRRVQNAAQLFQFPLDFGVRAFRVSDALESLQGLLRAFLGQKPCRRLWQVVQGQGHRRQWDRGAENGHHRPVEHGTQRVADQHAHRNVQGSQRG